MSALPDWLRGDGDGCVLAIHAQPGARRTELAGVHGEAMKVRLAAPPADGKANAELLRFLAAQLGVARQAVQLVSGESARAKRVRIDGVTAAVVLDRLSGP